MTPEELGLMAAAERQARERFEHRLNVCTATACHAAGSDQLRAALAEEVKTRGLTSSCDVKGVGCPGLCSAAPLVSVEPGGTLYRNVAPSDVLAIVESLGGEPLDRL